MWLNYNCYGYCINKKGYSNQCYKYCFNKLSWYKSKKLLYFTHSFISYHITIANYYYLLSLCKTKKFILNNHPSYYFNDIIKLENFDLINILIDKKSHENILVHEISFKTLIDSKPLWIRFDKIDGIIRIYNGSRYLTLFGTKKYDAIYERIRYLISLKSSITYIFLIILWKSKWILIILYI